MKGTIDEDSICWRLCEVLKVTKHLQTLDLSGQPMSITALKHIINAMKENENWVENLGLANCELNDDAA